MLPVTTLKATIARGVPDALGWRDLVRSGGEPHRGQAPTGRVLACLWHLSDLHICDAESPARLEYLDRYSDPDSPFATYLGDIGTYRPQEILTVPVALQMVQTVNRIDRAPMSRSHIDAVLITGDVTDNAQHNELTWYRSVIDGGEIVPASGGTASTWCGVSDPETWDNRYWHPDGPPEGLPDDRPTRTFGFPRIPGLIEAARAPVMSPGLDYEVLSVHGNHDLLLQGTVTADAGLRARATGDRAITGLAPHTDPLSIAPAISPVGPAHYPNDPAGPSRAVAADARRRIVEPGEFARTLGLPQTYGAHDVGDLRVICLDTVNPHGGWQGSLDRDQFVWLERELWRAEGRRVVIASHHPSPAMTNDYAPDGRPRLLGADVVSLLLEHPCVIAWVAGHVHLNAVLHHGPPDGGFVEIVTSSLIDWPQQGRILEFIEVGPDVAIVSTLVDHCSPIARSGDALDSPALASISRLLAANDYHDRDGMAELRRGEPEARNAVWWVRRP